jgi:hypothetical protein
MREGLQHSWAVLELGSVVRPWFFVMWEIFVYLSWMIAQVRSQTSPCAANYTSDTQGQDGSRLDE